MVTGFNVPDLFYVLCYLLTSGLAINWFANTTCGEPLAWLASMLHPCKHAILILETYGAAGTRFQFTTQDGQSTELTMRKIRPRG